MKVNLGVETYVQAQGDFGKVYDSTFKILYWTVPSWILDNLSGFMFEVANKVLQTDQQLTFFFGTFSCFGTKFQADDLHKRWQKTFL